MAGQTFDDLFCHHFDCPCLHYEERAFQELLYGHAKLVAPIVHKLRPTFFAEDFKFILALGDATDLREAMAIAGDFQTMNLVSRSFWRKRLKMRVSGGKATTLARQLFSIEKTEPRGR